MIKRPVLVSGGLLLAAIVSIFFFFNPAEAQQDPLPKADPLHPVEVFRSTASARTITEAFAQAGVDYYPEDIVSAFPDPALGLGSVITIKRALPITLRDGKTTYRVRTWEQTVGSLIKEKGIELGDEDRVSPNLMTPLQKNMPITITRVARTNVTETEVIPAKTVVQKDYYQFVGTSSVVNAGRSGERKNVYLVIREDGELISKTLISTGVVSAAQDRVVREGALNRVNSRCLPYKDWVVDASLKNGIDPNALFFRIFRESSCNPSAEARAGYQGLLQYDPGLWPTLSARAGFKDASIWDARSQIYVTAWAWANGHRSRWPIP